ncbi:MAG: NAD(P)/FAD-dependent oxidoreductase [Pseudomonadales bacterium]|nr:NAD(P)/FAD-dependent oxidoreductase [Pseudomonadales bacterium]
MTLESAVTNNNSPDHEVIIIGAGVCGIYMLHRMLKLGLDVTLLEAGDGPGGTWHWNRYPGARFDSESYTYGYSFSKELLQEWSWSEHFAAQPETLSYLKYVINKFDLASHMQFDSQVKAATFDEESGYWRIDTAEGRTLTSRYLLTAIGMLSAATKPRLEGLDSFEGVSFHTYNWPETPVELKGKKVAVIGTGATGVQVIQSIAGEVGELTVFQRRPNWCAPLHNSPISDEEQTKIKASFDDIFARCMKTPGGFIHGPDRREFATVSEEDRMEFWENLYASPGFGVWLGNFRDVLTNLDANAEFSEFIANKIRGRVQDPAVAEMLIPKDHGFGSRRVPMETRYYEAYNRDNVQLVNVSETPIEKITKKGIKTSDAEYEFDIIIYATGFDAITGAFDRINITGLNGQTLRSKWDKGPLTLYGLQVAGFPNLITLAGPQGASVSTNFPPGIENAVDWTTDLIKYMGEHNYKRVEASDEAEQAWVKHVKEMYGHTLVSTTKSWFTGYNSNVEGHDILRHMVYFGGAPKYRERIAQIAANDYEGFEFA